MTRKDYIAIAAAIKDASREGDDGRYVPHKGTCARIAYAITDAMQSDNQRFDRARFLKACGIA